MTSKALSTVLNAWGEAFTMTTQMSDAYTKPAGLKVTATYITLHNGKKFILKDVTHALNRDRLDTEYRLLSYLNMQGVPVAVPVLTTSGEPYSQQDNSLYMLYPALPVSGDATPEFDSVQKYRNLGTALACLHVALASYPERVDSWTMNLPQVVFDEAIPQILSAISNQEQLSFTEIVARIEPELRAALQNLPVQLIHGDCHGGNVLFYHGEVSGFIDLDHTPYGPRVYDIGYFLAGHARWSLLDGGPDEHNHFGTLLQAYDKASTQPLSTHERRALWFIMLSTQLAMAYWLFKHGNAEFGNKHLHVFSWIHTHRESLEAQFVGA